MKRGRRTARAGTSARKHPMPARHPLLGGSSSDAVHNVACALAYVNTAEVPEHASDDVCFGRFLLVETLIHALCALAQRHEREAQVIKVQRDSKGRAP